MLQPGGDDGEEDLFGSGPAGVVGASAGGPPNPPSGVYVRVAVERAMDEAGLTYAVPPALLATGPMAVGERVEVPLGGRRAGGGGRGGGRGGGGGRSLGIVVAVGGSELAAGIPPGRVRGVLRRMGGRLTPDLLDLARWMARYYVAPLGMVLGAMVPAAVKRGTGRAARSCIVEVRPPPSAEPEPEVTPQLRLAPRARAAWSTLAGLPAGTLPMAVSSIGRHAPGVTPAMVRSLAAKGLLRLETIERWMHEDPADDLGPEGDEDPDESAEVDSDAVGDAVGDAVAAAMALVGGHGVPDAAGSRPEPTTEQRQAIEGIISDLRPHLRADPRDGPGEHASPGSGVAGWSVHLVSGVTGSGKTEVYLRVIEEALARGLSALVLVPEIILTPQTAARFESRLGADRVAVLHSGLSATQRHRAWARAAEGSARVVVGARSALFAPLSDLGVIVVDEEHDGSFKHDQVPRYSARDGAIKRGQLVGATVVLGSATPSLESWRNATAQGSPWRLWRLTQRVGSGALPSVRIVDLAQERRARAAMEPNSTRLRLLGPTLERELGAALSRGEQAIVMLNRRGMAHYLCCPSNACGYVLECDDCDATMVLHKDEAAPAGRLVRCHHCLTERIVPTLCPACGKRLVPFGGGTQRLEEELAGTFASAGLEAGTTLLRVDGDTMRRAGDYARALSRFAEGRARVLVGTQMLAKGLDFPGVSLVGVVDADTSLSLADFRAHERTFQLVCQVAGRAGRGSTPGRVIVQTWMPDHPAIVLAARHDFEAFAAMELGARRAAGLPPMVRLARIVCRDVDRAKAIARAEGIVAALRTAPVEGLAMRGPFPCAIARIAGRHRIALDVLAPRADALQRALAHARAARVLLSDAATAIDVDPVSLL